MSQKNWPLTLVLASLAMAVLLLGFPMADVQRDHSVEWCENHDGEVSYSNVIGSHGGFHCHLPNGSVEHVALTLSDKLT